MITQILTTLAIESQPGSIGAEVFRLLISFATGGIATSLVGSFLKSKSDQKDRRRAAIEQLYLDLDSWLMFVKSYRVCVNALARGECSAEECRERIVAFHKQRDQSAGFSRIKMRCALYFPTLLPKWESCQSWWTQFSSAATVLMENPRTQVELPDYSEFMGQWENLVGDLTILAREIS